MPLKPLSQIDQIAFVDLVEKCHDAVFDDEFPANGSFLKRARKDQQYWCYRGYNRDPHGAPGATVIKYAGRVGDPELERRIACFGSIKSDYRARRELAAKLRRAGLPAPMPIEGATAQALAETGIFRARAVLVGSAAYQSLQASFPGAPPSRQE
jgi:hypothetical protein